YKIFNANSHSAYRLRTDAFRLVTRRAINRVHATSPHLPYRKAAYAASGLKMTDIEFDGRLQGRAPGRFGLAADSLVLYTDAGFKFSAGIALVMMALAVVELVYTLVIFCTGQPIEVWTTTKIGRASCREGMYMDMALAAAEYDARILSMSLQR